MKKQESKYYYTREKEIIKKYEIEFEISDIEDMKYKIIDECSEVRHRKGIYNEDFVSRFSMDDYARIRNLSKKLIEKYETNDFYNPRIIEIYDASFDEYIFPHIISLIDELLKGNSDVLHEILNYKEVLIDSKKELEKKINEMKENIDKVDPNKLKNLIEEYQSIKPAKSVKPYLAELRSMIKFILVDEIAMEDINRVYSFVDEAKNSKFVEILCIKNLKN